MRQDRGMWWRVVENIGPERFNEISLPGYPLHATVWQVIPTNCEWKMLGSTHTFLNHKFQLLSCIFQHGMSYEMIMQLRISTWSFEWNGGYHVPVFDFLEGDCKGDVMILMELVELSLVRINIRAWHELGPESVIRLYPDYQVHRDIGVVLHSIEVYGKQYLRR